MITEQDPGFEALLEHLTRYRRIDFSGYKQSNLFRQVMSRMYVARVGDCVDYLAYLDEHPAEYTTLFDSILINVTGFFRDEAGWTYVRDAILPHLLAVKPAEQPVQVWSAGCASGEEAYTLAMLFGVDQNRLAALASKVHDGRQLREAFVFDPGPVESQLPDSCQPPVQAALRLFGRLTAARVEAAETDQPPGVFLHRRHDAVVVHLEKFGILSGEAENDGLVDTVLVHRRQQLRRAYQAAFGRSIK